MSTQGQPGEKGENAHGSIGGTGGAGGAGGQGETTGGVGGSGGTGGRGDTGPRGPQGKSAPHRALIGYLILAAAVVAAFVMSWENDNMIENQAEKNCLEIESIKTQQRADVWDRFNNLKRNAKILNIPVTPQLRDIAKKDRDAALIRYKKESCPRKL